MKLREFSLWAYKLELNDSRNFTLENRCICSHLERHFNEIDTENIYRVVIKLSDTDPRDGTIEESSSVLKFYEQFDFEHFYKLEGSKRKEYTLETLYKSLLKVCELKKWNTEPFKLARQAVLDENFDNSYEIRSKNNRAKSMIASLNAKHTENLFTLTLVVKNKQGKTLLEKEVLTEEPDEFIFNSQVGDLKWVSNELLTYIAKDKSVVEEINIKSNG